MIPLTSNQERVTAMSVKDISQWIDNDEGLYCWWKSSKQSKRDFIKDNRAELETCINQVVNGKKRPHYLMYG